MLALFRTLLYLYPAEYRREYGDEMLTVLVQVQAEARMQAPLQRSFSFTREAGGLLRGALEQHLHPIYQPQSFPVFSSRRLAMRSEFRFPKATVGLMTLVLLAIIAAIEKAKAISQSVAPSSTPVGRIVPPYVSIVPTFLIALAGVCVCGTLVWAVLFALHRSGTQRLSDLKPSAERRCSGSLLS
jgi:hypothetical protein